MIIEEAFESAKAEAEELREKLKEKELRMKSWKDKMKGIVAQERVEITQLREAKMELEGRVEGLVKELAELKDGAGEGGNLNETFERFKERTNVAMKLRTKELTSLQQKCAVLGDELKAARLELREANSMKLRQTEEITRLNEQATQAAISVARQLEIHSNEVERLRRLNESEKLSGLNANREALQELKDQYEAKMMHINKLHEQEVGEQSMHIDGAHASAVTAAENRVDDLLGEAVGLSAIIESKETEIARLKGELAVRTAAPASRSEKQTEATIRELETKVKRLTEENEHQVKRAWSLQRELIEAKEAAGELKEKPTTAEDLSYSQKQSYLKGVLLKFLTASTEEMKGSLMPLLATLLQLSSGELKDIYLVNPDWAM